MMEYITKRLSILFSSSTPWLVIAVGLGVNILGDGISNTVIAWRSNQSPTPSLWLIMLGLAVILILLVSTDLLGQIRSLFQSNWQQKLITPNFEGEVKARPGLVVLVSSRPNPPAKYAVEHHAWNMIPGEQPVLKYCWLIAGPGDGEFSSIDNAQRLEASLQAQNIKSSIILLQNSMDVEHAYLTAKKAMREAFDECSLQPKELIADYTGGTKPMTVGMLLAAIEFGVDLQYMDSKQLKKGGRVEKAAGAIARPVNLSFYPK